MNDHIGFSRRAACSALIGSVGALAWGAPATAQAPTRFRSVRVDAGRLAAIGARGPAEVVAQVLPGELGSQFADMLAPANARAPTLVARVDRLFLSSFADGQSNGIGAFDQMDSMEGAGLVVAGRQVLATTPLRVTLPAGFSGAYYLPDIDVRRITSLCQSFASWLRREMNS